MTKSTRQRRKEYVERTENINTKELDVKDEKNEENEKDYDSGNVQTEASVIESPVNAELSAS